jgi:hypothetical protein
MFCRHCGKQINPKRFCKYCGNAIVLPAQASTANDQALAESPSGDSLTGAAVCPYCREEIKPGAIKCKHCGSDLKTRALTPQMDARIRDELRRYQYVISLRCMECGYSGPMGLVKQNKPLYQRRGLQYLYFSGFRSLPLLGAVFEASFFRGKPVQNVVSCPSCRKTLVTQNPPAEKSLFMIR